MIVFVKSIISFQNFAIQIKMFDMFFRINSVMVRQETENRHIHKVIETFFIVFGAGYPVQLKSIAALKFIEPTKYVFHKTVISFSLIRSFHFTMRTLNTTSMEFVSLFWSSILSYYQYSYPNSSTQNP